MKLAGAALPPWELVAIIALIAAANLLTGFESSVISGPLAAVAAEFKVVVNSEAYGFLASAHPVGATVASLPFVAGALQDLFSRKMVLAWTCALYICAVAITFTSASYGAFVTGRFFSGVTSGIISSVVPVYLSEVAGAAYRGYVVSLAQVSIVAGVLFGFCADYAFIGRWRWAFTMFVPLAAVLAVLLAVCAPFSPRWLVLQGRDDEARAVLRLLRVGGAANRPLFWLPFARRRTVPAPAPVAAAASAPVAGAADSAASTPVVEGDAAAAVKPTLAIIDAADGSSTPAASAASADPYAAVESELRDIKRMAAGIVLSYAAELVPLSPGGHAPGPNTAVAGKPTDLASPAPPADDWVARYAAAMPGVLRPSGASQTRLRRLSSWPVLVAISTGFLLGAFQQLSGMNAINKYAPTIFIGLGFNADVALKYSIYLGIVKLGFVIVGDLIMDRLKRRTLLLIGAAGMAVSQWTLGGLLTRHDAPPGLQFFFLLSYVAWYEVSVGPLLWVLCAEMFPLSIRGVAMSSGSTSCWLFTFVVSQFFPRLLADPVVGLSGAFLVFGGFCGACFVWGWWAIPDTLKASLETIEEQGLMAPPSMRHFSHHAAAEGAADADAGVKGAPAAAVAADGEEPRAAEVA